MHMATAESQYQHENKKYNTVEPNNNNVLVSIKALVEVVEIDCNMEHSSQLINK